MWPPEGLGSGLHFMDPFQGKLEVLFPLDKADTMCEDIFLEAITPQIPIFPAFLPDSSASINCILMICSHLSQKIRNPGATHLFHLIFAVLLPQI